MGSGGNDWIRLTMKFTFVMTHFWASMTSDFMIKWCWKKCDAIKFIQMAIFQMKIKDIIWLSEALKDVPESSLDLDSPVVIASWVIVVAIRML